MSKTNTLNKGREIKFRAWVKNKKIMTFVGEIAWLVGGMHVGDAGANQGWVGKEMELMQFTGLTDKNGKEIYEGDLLRHPDIKRLIEVDDIRNIGGFEQDGLLFSFTEVIGNKFENPELLSK